TVLSTESDAVVIFEVELSRNACVDFEIQYGVSGSAINGVHYNSLQSGSFTIPQGQSSVTVSFSLQQNALAEADKFLQIALKGTTTPGAKMTLAAQSYQTHTILD